MTGQSKVIVSLCFIIVLSAAVALYCHRRREEVSVLPENVPSESDPVIKRGDKGANVLRLQKYLNARLVCYLVYDKPVFTYGGKAVVTIDEDGIFGPMTESACVWWFGKSSVKLSELN